MPNFVGQWFPRNDEPSQAELYAASMLLLLSPWTSIAELKGSSVTFQECFQTFRESAPTRITRIMDNIQYYYESSDRARQKVGPSTSGGLIDINMPEDEKPYPDIGETEMGLDVTDEDIECSRSMAEMPREQFFGEHAVSTTIDAGIFSANPPLSVYRRIAYSASFDDLRTFIDWTKTLKSITRSGNLSTTPTPDINTVNPPQALPNPFTPGVHQATDAFIDYKGMISRERLAVLNADQ